MPIATTKKPLKGGFFVSALYQQCPVRKLLSPETCSKVPPPLAGGGANCKYQTGQRWFFIE
jgi:hypothetical protein